MNTVASAWSRTHHNINLAVICGFCNNTLAKHDDLLGTDDECLRNSTYDDLDFVTVIPEIDYFAVLGSNGEPLLNHVLPYFDHSGNPTSPLLDKDYDRDLEDAYVSFEMVDAEWTTINQWRDQDPNICTVTLEQSSVAKEALITDNGLIPNHAYSEFIEPALRNAYVEGNDAFLSLQVLDPELTRKYHARLLNWFLDKSGEVRVGSMRFFVNPHGERIAQCVRSCTKDSHGNWIKPGARIDDYSHSREAMENFILSVIRHGNNCAASFIRTRPDWYAIGESLPRNTTDNDVAFVMDHQRYCKDARCKCSEWLASEVPALRKVS